MNPLTLPQTLALFREEMHIHLPELEAVDADQLPESVRGLLSHDMDMTGVLEARHKSVIHLEVLQKQVLDREMRREVVLRTERGEAAEYGAIRIYLEEFPPNAQSEIVDGERPLGTIMKQHAVRFVSRPVVFFKLQADDLLSKLFTQPLDAPLFGRLNRLSHRTGGVLADVVEILPLGVHVIDVAIIGGGPAGATAACALAQRGRSVLILEKDHFPRYHIGESMIPFCYFPLERIGFIDKLKTSRFPKKYSVQFVSVEGKVSKPFYFFKHMNHDASTTWQVVRSEFDELLLQHAVEQGARLEIGAKVKDFIMDGDRVAGVIAEKADGTLFDVPARAVIDASGRNAFSIRKFQWQERDPELRKVVIWTYYEGAKRDEGIDEAATTVAYVPEKGWFWYIPLPDNKVSVGIVAEKDYLYRDGSDPEQVFEREIEQNPWVQDHLSCGRRCAPYSVTADFSYRSRYCSREGLLLTGDAFSFLDPVFSSGLFLAFWGGEKAAIALDRVLSGGNDPADVYTQYATELRAGLEAMRKLVYAFYDSDFHFGKLVKAHPDLEGDLTDCLIGNVEKDFGPLFQAISSMARIPDSLSYGTPLLTSG